MRRKIKQQSHLRHFSQNKLTSSHNENIIDMNVQESIDFLQKRYRIISVTSSRTGQRKVHLWSWVMMIDVCMNDNRIIDKETTPCTSISAVPRRLLIWSASRCLPRGNLPCNATIWNVLWYPWSGQFQKHQLSSIVLSKYNPPSSKTLSLLWSSLNSTSRKHPRCLEAKSGTESA